MQRVPLLEFLAAGAEPGDEQAMYKYLIACEEVCAVDFAEIVSVIR